jgi:hypothetical protein
MKKEKLMEILKEVFEESREISYGRCGDWYFDYDDLDDIMNNTDIQKMIDKFLNK